MEKLIFIYFFLNLSLFFHIGYGNERYVIFQNISISEGLSHNHTTSVIRDTMGFLWVGTTDGLNRYDGYSFKVYRRTSNPNSLSNNFIQDLFLDSRGILWIGTKEGLNRYNPEQDNFVHYRINPLDSTAISDNDILTIYEDTDKNLWIGTKFGGLNFFDVENDVFKAYRHDPFDDRSISSNYVTAVQEDAKGRLWAGTYDGGVNVLNPENNSFIRFKYEYETHDISTLSNNTVLSLHLGADSNLWIGTSFLLNKVVVKNDEWEDFDISFTRYRNPLLYDVTNNRINAIIQDTEKEFFISYKNEGLFSFNPNDETFIRYRNLETTLGYSHPLNILDLFSDHDGLLWMPTREAGLKQYNPRITKFGHIKNIPEDPASLPDNIINDIAFDSDGQMWVANYSKGIAKYDSSKKQFINYQAPPGHRHSGIYNRITAILIDSADRIWLGTTYGILHFTEPEIKKNKYLTRSLKYNFLGASQLLTINCFFQDSEGFVWAGSQQGLIKIDHHSDVQRGRENPVFYSYDLADTMSLIDNNVLAINEDQQGNLWIGTERGLCRMNKEQKNFFCYTRDENDSLTISSNHIHSIYIDQKNIIWIGTDGGLNRFDPEKEVFTSITTHEGLPNNTVWGIVEDDNNTLWLSTNNGLASYNKLTHDIKRFGKSDGLQSNLFRYGAYAKSQNGKLCFGGNNGLNLFDPEKIEPDPIPPKLVLTGFKCFNKDVIPGEEVKEKVLLNKSIFLTEKIELKHYHNVITLEFAALQFTNPSGNQYLYMLEGFDEEWIPFRGGKPVVTYTNLPPGDYRFIAKASNSSGIWSEDELILHLHILPPFYRTIWFYAFCFLLLAGCIVLLIKIREKRLLESNMLLNYEKDLLQTLFDNIPDHIFFKDKNSRFIRINKAMAKNLGLNHPDEAVEKSDFDFLPAEIAKQTLQEEYKILKKGDPIINDIVKRIRMDKEVWVSVTKVPMFNKSGEIAGVVGISRDFTSQKKAEIKIREAEKKAIEADRMKTVFLANMSHEVRTPMNSIVGFSDLLDDPDIGAKERKDYVSYIKNNSEILMRLIDDILDTAKIEANQVKIIRKEFNLNQFMDELLDTFEINKVKLHKPHLKLSLIKSPEKKKLKVFSDPYRLKQVMSNLINNAIKFTEEGSVSFGYEVRENHSVYFFVRDTGIGIEPEMQKIVFRRFNHSEGRFEKTIQGTGLGLSISSKLVALLGGEIKLQSKPGEGSVFSFTLSNIIG